MRVKVRAVIIDRQRLLVVPERRRGAHSHMALPGGRVNPRETVTDAFERELREETGLDVIPRQLLYVAEVTAPYRVHELNLIFLAEPREQVDFDGLSFVELTHNDHPLILPPLVAEISRDHATGWAGAPRWLGNVWDDSLRESENSP